MGGVEGGFVVGVYVDNVGFVVWSEGRKGLEEDEGEEEGDFGCYCWKKRGFFFSSFFFSNWKSVLLYYLVELGEWVIGKWGIYSFG